jgi:hypothetical protein
VVEVQCNAAVRGMGRHWGDAPITSLQEGAVCVSSRPFSGS